MTGAQLTEQTVVVIGGSSGIGFETARCAREEGAYVILTARNADRLQAAGLELGASIAAFDATDPGRLRRFFDELPSPIDHLVLRGRDFRLPLETARLAVGKVRPGGSVLFLGHDDGTEGSLSGALQAMTSSLALELAPVRVNLILVEVGPTDVAAVAVRLMADSSITGAIWPLRTSSISSV
jgi:NAD(P)-dependent dehydrogenase (short-subunit alcohol dehydrogenase family)